jgi:hypothetical protein
LIDSLISQERKIAVVESSQVRALEILLLHNCLKITLNIAKESTTATKAEQSGVRKICWWHMLTGGFYGCHIDIE